MEMFLVTQLVAVTQLAYSTAKPRKLGFVYMNISTGIHPGWKFSVFKKDRFKCCM
jgi:hypothetical protein